MKRFSIFSTALLSFLAITAHAQDSLIDLVKAGRHDAAMTAVASADVNATAADGTTALMYATYNVDTDLVRAAGSRCGCRCHQPIWFLAAGGSREIDNEELVRILLDAGADPDSLISTTRPP